MLVVEATLPLWCAAALVPAAKPVAARRDVLLGAAAAAATTATSGPSAAVANTAVPKSAVGVTESGVKYFDVKEGNGGSPRPGQLVIVKYKGFLSDGKMFDSSDGPGRKPIAAKFKAKPAQLLPGWEEVLETMRVGGTRVAQVQPCAPWAGGMAPRVFPIGTRARPARLLSRSAHAPRRRSRRSWRTARRASASKTARALCRRTSGCNSNSRSNVLPSRPYSHELSDAQTDGDARRRARHATGHVTT